MTTDEFSPAFSSAFDPVPGSVSGSIASCVTPDLSCCPDWDTAYDEVQQDLAVLMAQETLRMLTGYRTANCPVTLRPCRKGCPSWPTWATFPVGASGQFAGSVTGPLVVNGEWYNIGCGCGADDCDCTAVCEIWMPGTVASVQQVLVDGVAVDPTAYRIDNGSRLVRTDGECWPLCQDMTTSPDQPNTFAVTYTPGIPLDAWGQRALGVLACEYAKAACGTGKCRLPANVTQVVRQGVTLDLTQNPFPSGLTGIREVDGYIRRVNPYGLAGPSRVYSPDIKRGRTTTWVAPAVTP